MDCLFCKIVNGEIPSYTIYEDEFVKVFLDIHPDSNGHALIIPKKHTLDVTTIDEETYIYIRKIAIKVKQQLEEKLHCDGIILTQNNGAPQLIKHYHLHVIPFYQEEQAIETVEQIYTKITKNA